MKGKRPAGRSTLHEPTSHGKTFRDREERDTGFSADLLIWNAADDDTRKNRKRCA
jgi:hypothetical protein